MNNKSLINWHWQLNTEAVIPVAVVAWYETVPRLLIYLLKNQDKYDLQKFNL